MTGREGGKNRKRERQWKGERDREVRRREGDTGKDRARQGERGGERERQGGAFAAERIPYVAANE